MSKTAVEQILRKATSDARFRTQLKKDFDVAVKPYTLTATEKTKLRATGTITSPAVPERQAAPVVLDAQRRIECLKLLEGGQELAPEVRCMSPRTTVPIQSLCL